MQFQPDMPQDRSPSSNACTLREERDVFCALLSKRTKNIYRSAGLDSGHQTSRTEAYSKLAHSAVHILQLQFPERHTALWEVTLSQTAWEHSYSHGTLFRNVTPHIFSAAFGEFTFTGLWTNARHRFCNGKLGSQIKSDPVLSRAKSFQCVDCLMLIWDIPYQSQTHLLINC